MVHLLADFDRLEAQPQRVLLMSADPILIAGDLNCDLLGPDSNGGKVKLTDFMHGFNLYQSVEVPTFRTGSLLDVFISDSVALVQDVCVLPCSYSDHSFTMARLIIPKFRARPSVVYSR